MRRPANPTRQLLSQPRHVVAFLRLLVFAGLTVLGLSDPPVHVVLFWTVTIVYGVTVLGYLWARNGDYARRRVRCVIFLFDALVVSALIVLRGRDVQGLVMAYFTLVFLAALLAGVGRPLLNAVIVAVLYHLVSLRGLSHEEVFTFERVGQLVFFFVIAAFMGYVAREAQTGQDAESNPAGDGSALQESTRRLRDARERLDADERLRTLDMISMGIAHEVRSPIAVIRQGVDEGPALLDDLEESVVDSASAEGVIAELRTLFEDSAHAVRKLHQVGVGLDDLGCGGAGGLAEVQPAEVLERARHLLLASVADDVVVEVRCQATTPVRAHAPRLLQVILNLAVNGIDAMRCRSDGVLRIEASDGADNSVVFTIVDAGVGIAPEVQERMFDPFYTTKAPGEGTGLGLYVAREIVRSQAGSIACESQPGRGTAFRVEFPAAA